MALVPILVFPNWNKELHVHVDSYFVALGVVLVQPGESDLDHPITFASRKLSFPKKITQPLRERDWPWFMHCRSLGTICWVVTSKCSRTTPLCNIWSISLGWGEDLLMATTFSRI